MLVDHLVDGPLSGIIELYLCRRVESVLSVIDEQ